MPPPQSLPGLPDDYTSQFFLGDIVSKIGEPSIRYRVLRSWADEDHDMPLPPPGHELHPLDRPLKRGEVGIGSMRNIDELAIVPESSVQLVSREFLTGDLVKRSLTQSKSGIITRLRASVQVEHVFTKQRLDAWIPQEKLKSSLMVERKDKVFFDEWVGSVEDVYEEGQIEGSLEPSYRVQQPGGSLNIGGPVGEHSCNDPNCQHALPGKGKAEDICVALRALGVIVSWTAINQELPVSEQEAHPEPTKNWFGPDMKRLTLYPGLRANTMVTGACVQFADESDDQVYGLKPSLHCRDTVRLRAMIVKDTQATATVRWQTGEEEEIPTTELVPYKNVDDYESWPGEHLLWKGDNGERRPAVLQTFDPDNRIADILFIDTPPPYTDRQTVSVLELDPGGPGKAPYGVGIGSAVLLTPDNLVPMPEVGVLGQPPEFMDELDLDAQMNKVMISMLAQRFPDAEIALPNNDLSQITWYGEVTALHLDGRITVTLPGGGERVVGLKNIVLLNDGMSPEAMLDAPVGMDIDGDSAYDDDLSDQSWETMSGEDVVMDEDVVVDEDQDENEDQAPAPEDEDEDAQDERSIEAMYPPEDGVKDRSRLTSSPVAGPSTFANGGTSRTPLAEDDKWVRFEMLEEAPQDHHFISEPRTSAPGKAYLSRLNKEHKALMSSLPENILVRTYENRTDLMRCLIIGPEGTPYADAPFVFDVYLNPTKFPNDPPSVFFHSHTNGHGRCNPNLYEDGKVCLSILGTWSGDKSESWSPTKSSLLQVFVSISGLVLVRSPYHCEPAFAKLEGTREGKINSRLYSEKAYVLTRSFVRTALQNPPSGLADELRHFYLTRGRLKAVIDHAQRLMEKGEATASGSGGAGEHGDEENAEMWNADAMGSLTKGAIISLRRTITSLEKLLAEST